MPIGPGALGFLTQQTHYQARNPADGWLRGVESREEQQYLQGKQELEREAFEEDKRRAGLDESLKERKFAYEQSEVKRKEKAAAFDRLQEAIRSKNPEAVRQAIEDARRYGIDVPGYQVPAQTEQAPPEQSQEQKEVEKGQAQPAKPAGDDMPPPWLTDELGKRDELPTEEQTAAPPPEAKPAESGTAPSEPLPQAEPPPEPPAPWLTREMEARGEIPVQPLESGYTSQNQGQVAPQNRMPEGMPPPELAPRDSGAGLEHPVMRAGDPPAQMQHPVMRAGDPPPQMQHPVYRPPADGPAPFGLGGGAPPAQPQQPRGLPIVDMDTGEVVGSFDLESATARARGRIAEHFDPIAKNGTEEERAAAEVAKVVAQSLVGQEGVTVEEAIERGFALYNETLDRDTAKKVAGVGEGAGDGLFGAPSITRTTDIQPADRQLGDYVYRNIVRNLQGVEGTKELVSTTGTMGQLVSSLDADFGYADAQSLRNLLMLTEGKRQTDTDLNYALNSAGKMQGVINYLKSWTPGGGFTETYKQQLRSYANLIEAETLKRQARALRRARAAVAGDPNLRRLPPEEQELWAQQAARMVSGTYIPPADKSQRELDGPKPKKKAKGGLSDKSTDDLIGELE